MKLTIFPQKIICLQIIIFFSALNFLSGCSLFTAKHTFPLLTNSNNETWAAQQQWIVTRGAQTYRLQAIIETAPQSWQLVVLDPLGQRLFTAKSIAGTVSIERQGSHPLDDLFTDFIEAVQWSYWPLADLQKSSAPWQFQQTAQIRQIYFSGILQATVTYQIVTDPIATYQTHADQTLTSQNKTLRSETLSNETPRNEIPRIETPRKGTLIFTKPSAFSLTVESQILK